MFPGGKHGLDGSDRWPGFLLITAKNFVHGLVRENLGKQAGAVDLERRSQAPSTARAA